MAFAFIFIGLILIIVGATGETEKFGETIKSDLVGDGSSAPFATWLFAVLMIGLIGTWKPLRPVSDGFLGLVVLSFILSNQGLIGQLASAFGTPPPKPELRD